MSSRFPEIFRRYQATRALSRTLAAPLSDADATVQSMPDASPAKWHLAHTSWFFEAMVLQRFSKDYAPFDPAFGYLFNSYYEALGARHPRPRRGLLTRPTLDSIYAYRDHVDRAVEAFFQRAFCEAAGELIELGCHHESQHQELLLTDILHLFAQNPLRPAYKERASDEAGEATPVRFLAFAGGLAELGAGVENFAYDCERPRHRVFVSPYRLADRLVTNAEWIAFIDAGGYGNPLLWLSEGWAKRLAEGWTAPLYWERREGAWWTMTLSGLRRVDPAAPVAHVSYFEADAFARWCGKRLPTEAEWELAAEPLPMRGNFLETGRSRPAAAEGEGLRQMFGDLWEWTSSPFSPYPRFRPAEGEASEYNAKFMCGQFVLRGGSCVSPKAHIRATYRNFFPPDARWQFSGVRLAEDS
ncbi:ergothioneine biosynthesis protein EgtB [Rhodoblastus acidophilus]|uniref:ergothioneine biosynthesis protein EgtB n=1 Tax=Rhodoblastus acidophilus TaxID=1074 RepID=UPI002224AE61|nr:ergothioneine biosynthesis protein EgtB [Rhodoblastus acidophilus]MCW2283186.1 ergothioneine biosynthesis protein EgtB [Rhodoblastus acidophilus]MCW2332046.1 ergothioneine biosynthesis protein EgtB [Rhodoblastus acidophilus]